LGIMGLLSLSVITGRAAAQEYEQQALAQDQSGKTVGTWTMMANTNESKAVVDMLSGNAALDTASFDKFFNTMMFPLFTRWQDVKAGGKTYSPLLNIAPMVAPAQMRQRFRQEYANRATNAAAHERMNQAVLAAMEKIANGNYHPVCRNAAIMLIGDLNETDPNGPPYKKALPVLLKAATAANTIPHVRLAAWRDILRHAAAGIDAENRPAVTSAALAALKQHAVPEGRSPIDHDWTCRRAIDVLAAIGEPGTGGAVVSTLLAIIHDGDTPIAIRCAAAEALPAVKFTPQQAGDAAGLVKTLGKLAVEDAKSHVANAKANNVKIPVEEIKAHLGQVRKGLNALTSANVTPPVGQLAGQIDNLSRACDTKPAEPTALGPSFNAPGTGPPVPTDTQAKIAKAILDATESLDNALTGGGNPAGASPFP